MKRLYLLIPLTLLLCMLFVGLYCIYASGVPAIGLNGFTEGEYVQQFQKHLSEGFPGSKPLEEIRLQMNGFYHFSAVDQDGDIQLLIPITNDAADHGAALQPQEPEEPKEEIQETQLEETIPIDDSTEPTEPAPTETEVTEPHEEEPPVEVLGQILLMGDRAIELPVAKYSAIEEYAKAVDRIANALDGVNTYSLLVPNAAGLYAPVDYQSDIDSQESMISYAYSLMDPKVKTTDAYSLLLEHKDKYLYFRTDHHWTHLGSYYAYVAWCETAGFEPQKIEDFQTGSYETFLGTMYGFLSKYPQREVLKENPDSLTYYIPSVESKAKYYDTADMSYGTSIDVIYPLSSSRSNKYLCFLAGDHPITVIETGLEEERTCILIKESYGNAFSTWLTGHYSKIICIDPREFNRNEKPSLDLVKFAKKVGADDCIILNYPIMINSSAYSSWLGRLIK